MNLNQTHQSLKRGLRIIEVIATMGGSMTLAEIGRKTGLARSTAHHLPTIDELRHRLNISVLVAGKTW